MVTTSVIETHLQPGHLTTGVALITLPSAVLSAAPAKPGTNSLYRARI
jgi:hypothetical protein